MIARSSSRGLAAFALAVSALTLSVAILAAAPARAGGPAEDTLRLLYRVALSADVCGFPIADRQSEALGRAMNVALAESGLDDDAADRLYQEVDASLQAEGLDRVCAQNGEWARNYRALLAANTH